MSMRHVVAYVVLMTALQCQSWAGAQITLINENITRDSGSPGYGLYNFIAGEGDAILSVGNSWNSSAVFTLNGVEILKQSDFRHTLGTLEKRVKLFDGENTLEINISSKPGSSITFSLIQEMPTEAIGFIGSEGGVVEVTDFEADTYGTVVEIPPGALIEDTTITVSSAVLPDVYPEGQSVAGAVVDLGPEGLIFDTPILISLPYNDKNNDGVIDGTVSSEKLLTVQYFNASLQEWEPVQTIGHDLDNNLIYFEVNHFSIYSPFIGDQLTVPTTTQAAPEVILIDGDPSDWAGLNYSRTDPSDDSTCGPKTDVNQVATAMDVDYLYFLIKQTQQLPVDQDNYYQIFFDHEPGEGFRGVAYADRVMYFGRLDYDGYESATVTIENNNGHTKFFRFSSNGVFEYSWGDGRYDDGYTCYSDSSHPNHNGVDCVGTTPAISFGIDHVEGRIPLELFNNPEYFNISNVATYIADEKCDEFTLHPSANMFDQSIKIQDLDLGANEYSRIKIFLLDQERNMVNEDVLASFDIYNPSGTLYEENIDTRFSIYEYWPGRYRYANGEWTLTYNSVPTIEYSYIASVDPIGSFGTYKGVVTTNNGNTFERTFDVVEKTELPFVDISTASCGYDVDGNLACYWTPPAEGGLDLKSISNMRVRVLARDDNGVFLRTIFLRMPVDFDTFTVSSDKMNYLRPGASSLEVVFETRANVGNYRAYSAPLPIPLLP